MIDAALLRRELVTEITGLHGEMRGQSGFEALTTAAAMLALERMMRAIGNSVVAARDERR